MLTGKISEGASASTIARGAILRVILGGMNEAVNDDWTCQAKVITTDVTVALKP
jgi:hypothetical protein